MKKIWIGKENDPVQNKKNIYAHLNVHDWLPERGKTGILIIDMQEYFREICRPILSNLINLTKAAKSAGIPLFMTQHGHESPMESGMLGKWWPDLIVEGSVQARLFPELEAEAQAMIIPKSRYSSFYGTDLESRLNERKVEDLVIGGVMTNLCCETTARDAFVRDFRVFFLGDGTSTVSEDYHLASLKNLAYGFATILTCNQLIHSVQNW